MENLDLDINNYSLNDIERFFKLNKTKYDVHDIELRETQIREQLLNSGHINKRFKSDLISFLDSGKKWLIDEKCVRDTTPTTIPTNHRMDPINNPQYIPPIPRQEDLINKPVTQYIYTHNAEFLPGNINQLNTRIITKCLNIDTRFRTNYHNTNSSDITIQLPNKLNKVVSMELSNIELPISFYGISSSYGNNYMHIHIKYKNKLNNQSYNCFRTIIIPDGNYTESDLIDVINYMLSKPGEPISIETDLYTNDEGNIVDSSGNVAIDNAPNRIYDVFSFIKFKLDLNDKGYGSRRVSIAPIDNEIVDITEIILDFSKTIEHNPDNTSIYTKLGWNLGFTKPIYEGDIFYCAEAIIEPISKYFFLAIDDFNNHSYNNYISNQTIMNSDILARISLNNNRIAAYADNNLTITTVPRQYFGPIDIQRIRVRLLDEQGRVLQLNNSNYSCCLKFKLLYDL